MTTSEKVGVGHVNASGSLWVACVVGWDSGCQASGGDYDRLWYIVDSELFWKGVLCDFVQVGGTVFMGMVVE